MAYVLGFFSADGNLVKSKRNTNFFSLEICDKEILEKIKKILNSSHKISERRKKSDSNVQYRLQIGSREMCDDLRKLGLTENKTYSMALPKVPEKFLFPYVRGYFDGDGHVWSGFLHKERKTPLIALHTVFTSCSHEFLSKLKERLERYDIRGQLRKSGDGNYFRLIYSIHSSLKLSDLMYGGNDDMLYLVRKKSIFDKYINMRV